MMMNLPRLWHTLRHLRSDQIVSQMVYRLRRVLENPQTFARRTAPAYPGCHWNPSHDFTPPGAQQNRQDDMLAGRLTFLNRTEAVGFPPRWQRDDLPKLWLYNLHYFEYLWGLDYAHAKQATLDWMQKHSLRRGAVGWEPYPTSLRLINLCGVFFGKFRTQTHADPEFLQKLWASIFIQAQWLMSHLETHLRANHLLENAAALTVVGNCFGHSPWTRAGRELLDAQLREQMLPDGGHFERSPMYHSRVVYLLQLLWNIGVMDLLHTLGDAERWLRDMCHPDGRIALFNDAAFGIYNDAAALTRARALPTGAFALIESGYFGARTPTGHYLVCDAGPIGPDFQPGHAHGDLLSFELSLFGQRVIVDSGVHDYEISEMRRYCRSTAAHNALEIDGQDQCEFWGAFRVARRGYPHNVRFEQTGQGFKLSAEHDGYRRLPSQALHAREFHWFNSGVLLVRDRVTANRSVAAVSRVHLHPACRIVRIDGSRALLETPGGAVTIVFSGPGSLRSETGWYCPEFGQRIQAPALAYVCAGAPVECGFAIVAGDSAVEFDLQTGAMADGQRYEW